MFVFVNGARYRNQTCGHCGYYDGNGDNDLTHKNGTYLQKTNLNVAFGNSWQESY